jgi:hypothetical protein
MGYQSGDRSAASVCGCPSEEFSVGIGERCEIPTVETRERLDGFTGLKAETVQG